MTCLVNTKASTTCGVNTEGRAAVTKKKKNKKPVELLRGL